MLTDLSTSVVFLVLLVFVDGLQQYICNTREKIDQIKSLNSSLRRLVEHGDRLYFVFQDRIISTELTASEDKGHYNFLNLNFQEVEIQDSPPDGIGKEQQVFGYYHDTLTNETSELYFVDGNAVRSAKEIKNQVYNKRFVLSFESGQVKRTRLVDLAAGLVEELSSEPNVIYVNGIRLPGNGSRELMVKYLWDRDESSEFFWFKLESSY